MGMGIAAKIMVFILILAAAILAKLVFLLGNVDIGIVHFLSSAIFIFALAQFYSICQNVYIFKTGKEVTEFDAMTLAIKGLQDMARRMLEAIVNKK